MQLLAVNTQLEYNTALIEEREQGIAEIAQQIGEVNEIFQDLAVLVNDQVGPLLYTLGSLQGPPQAPPISSHDGPVGTSVCMVPAHCNTCSVRPRPCFNVVNARLIMSW